MLVCAALTAALAVDALIRERGGFDYRLINAVRAIRFAGDDRVMESVSRLTATEGAILAWFVLLGAFVAFRRWLDALTLAVIPAASLISVAIQVFADRPRPDLARIHGLESAMRAAGDQDFASFPSGHVLGAVLLYGLLFALVGRMPLPPLRWALRTLVVGIVLLTGISRVWLGSHWVGDIVAAYTLGAPCSASSSFSTAAPRPTSKTSPSFAPATSSTLRTQHTPTRSRA